MKIPFFSLKGPHKDLKKKMQKAFDRVYDSGSYTSGKEVEAFERKFAKYNGSKYCVAVNSGTSALHLALKSLEINPDDDVAVPANTFIATAEAVSYCHAKPVFCDIELKTGNISLESLKKESFLQAVIPVHLFGQPCDIKEVIKFAKKKGIRVIEDCCQAHGASVDEKKVGTFGDVGCFSFYPTKNLGAIGEGGALITDKKDIYELAKLLRSHGQKERYYHERIGYNYRMEELQAAFLSIKLDSLDQWNEERRSLAKVYTKILKDRVALIENKNNSVYHLFVVRVPNRFTVIEKLYTSGIQTACHYPIPCHLQIPYRGYGLPNAERFAKECLSLPLYPGMDVHDVEYVAVNLIKALK